MCELRVVMELLLLYIPTRMIPQREVLGVLKDKFAPEYRYATVSYPFKAQPSLCYCPLPGQPPRLTQQPYRYHDQAHCLVIIHISEPTFVL